MSHEDARPTIDSLLAHRAWVRGIARALVADESRVDDVEQETWLVAMDRPPRGVGAVRAWLRRVVRSRAVDAHRSASRRAAREQATARPEGLPATADLVAKAEIQRDVAAAVCALAEPYRTTILLRHFEELEPREIAARLGVPVETVRTRIKRGHERLREVLDEEYGDRRKWALVLLPLTKPRRPISIGAATGGALVMAGKAKAVAVVVAVAALTAGVWWTAETETRAPVEVASTNVVPESSTVRIDSKAATATPDAADEVAAGVSVGVDVVDTAARPVLGARVEFSRDPAYRVTAASGFWLLALGSSADSASPAHAAATSADGAADVSGVGPGEWRLCVSAAGFALHEERMSIAAVPARHRVVLRPAYALVGRVLRADGSPAGGADVFAGTRHAKSDAAGRYRLDSLAAGVHSVRAGDVGGVVQEIAQVSVPEISELDLRLRGGCSFRGRVLDDATGDPIAGAHVVLGATVYADLPRMLGYGAQAVTGADGGFAWDDLPSGVPHLLWALADGYAPCRSGLALAPPNVHLAPGLGTVVEVRMRRGAAVRGRVLDPDGAPVAGALVDVLSRAGANEIANSDVVATGADGGFRILAMTGTAMVRARAAGARQRDFPAEYWIAIRSGQIPASCRVIVDAKREAAIDVVVVPDARSVSRGVLAGTVRREDELPADGVLLELVPAKWDEDSTRAVESGPKGAFRFEGLTSRSYVLRASAAGCAVVRVEPLLIPDAGVLEGVEVVLPREMTITGRVVDESGAPVAGAELTVAPSRWSGERGSAVAVSGRDGSFVVGRLARGDPFVTARASGFASSGRTIAAGSGDVTIRLERARTISGTVVDASTEAPVAGVPLYAEFSVYQEGSALYREVVSDAAGRFVIADLEPETYRLCVGTRTRWPWGVGEFLVTSVDGVRAGAEDVRVPMTRGLAIAGRVLDDAGRPAGGGVIDAILVSRERTRQDESARRARIRSDGTFRLSGLPPGVYDLAVGDDGGDPGQVRIEGVQAGTSDVVVTARTGQCIEGRLLLEDGSPLPQGPGSVQVRWKNEAGGLSWRELGVMWSADGSFRTVALEPGRLYDVVVTSIPGRLGAAVRGVKPGTTDLVVTVKDGGRITGRVVDASGAPVPAGVHVGAHSRASGSWPAEPGGYSFAETAADGTFTLPGLADTDYQLEAGGDPSEFIQTELGKPLQPGSEGVEIRVERGVTIAGRLADAKGVALKGGYVEVRGEDSHEGASVDNQGRFAVHGLRPGAYRLYTRVGQRNLDLGDVQAPAEGLVLTVLDE
jgi:RNA polymerase sigma-70 factor (ECF subfamily)